MTLRVPVDLLITPPIPVSVTVHLYVRVCLSVRLFWTDLLFCIACNSHVRVLVCVCVCVCVCACSISSCGIDNDGCKALAGAFSGNRSLKLIKSVRSWSCMCMRVCVCVCLRACVCVCMCVHVRACMRACVYVEAFDVQRH